MWLLTSVYMDNRILRCRCLKGCILFGRILCFTCPVNPTSMSSFEFWINRSWTWHFWSRYDSLRLSWSRMVAGTENFTVIYLLFSPISDSSSHVCILPRLLFGEITTDPEERLHIWTEIISVFPFIATKVGVNPMPSGKLDRGHGWTTPVDLTLATFRSSILFTTTGWLLGIMTFWVSPHLISPICRSARSR